MIPESTIDKAVEMLQNASHPVKIILFGSYANGQVTKDSDLDFLVVKRELKGRRKEMVRLRDVLSPLRIPVDVLVISEKTYQEWKTTPGTVIYEAATDGRLVYDAS